MRIERTNYLEKIKKLMGNGLVKVITGIRRCGKSYFLFSIFRDYLRSVGVADDQIVEVHLDEDEYEGLCTPRALSKYVKDQSRSTPIFYTYTYFLLQFHSPTPTANSNSRIVGPLVVCAGGTPLSISDVAKIRI